MNLTLRLDIINWLVGQSLTGLPENDLVRGFCERCRAGGLDLSRGLVVIDTLHPVFEGRGIQWNDTTDVIAGGSGIGLFLLWADEQLHVPAARQTAIGAGERLLDVASDSSRVTRT